MYGGGGGAAVLHPASQQPINFPSTSSAGAQNNSAADNDANSEGGFAPTPAHLRPGHRFKSSHVSHSFWQSLS